MKHLLLAYVIFRIVGAPNSGVKCDHWSQEWCGMNFWDCETQSTFQCMTNVEIVEENGKIPPPVKDGKWRFPKL